MYWIPRASFVIAAVFLNTATFATTFAVGNCKPTV